MVGAPNLWKRAVDPNIKEFFLCNAPPLLQVLLLRREQLQHCIDNTQTKTKPKTLNPKPWFFIPLSLHLHFLWLQELLQKLRKPFVGRVGPVTDYRSSSLTFMRWIWQQLAHSLPAVAMMSSLRMGEAWWARNWPVEFYLEVLYACDTSQLEMECWRTDFLFLFFFPGTDGTDNVFHFLHHSSIINMMPAGNIVFLLLCHFG